MRWVGFFWLTRLRIMNNNKHGIYSQNNNFLTSSTKRQDASKQNKHSHILEQKSVSFLERLASEDNLFFKLFFMQYAFCFREKNLQVFCVRSNACLKRCISLKFTSIFLFQLTVAPKFLPNTLISADFAANYLTKIYGLTFGQKPNLR